MKNGWDSGRGKKGTGTKFRKGGEIPRQSPFCALMFFAGRLRGMIDLCGTGWRFSLLLVS